MTEPRCRFCDGPLPCMTHMERAQSSAESGHPLAELPEYLDCLESELIELDVDMSLSGSIIPPGVWADRVRASIVQSPDVAQPVQVRAAAIEECAALMRRWRDEAAEFSDDRCRQQANLCQNASVAISNLAAQPPAAPVETDAVAMLWKMIRFYDEIDRDHADGEAKLLDEAARVVAAAQVPRCSAASEPAARNWIEDAPHENGNYECRCVECEQPFIGHKRRVICKACSNLLSPDEPQAAPAPKAISAAYSDWSENERGN